MKQHVSRFAPAIWGLAPLFLANSLFAQLPAFPGAEGFGKYATGGRGGSVYFVTTTNDSGVGSFREACSVSGRTIIFKVGGVFDYSSGRFAPKPNITIAGQTAPGDGVTIYGDGLSFSGSHNNICRFIRVRQGINGTSGTDAMGIANGNNMIFDHITSSWGRDETFSISGDITNITIQSSIISQGLQGHSAGGLIQTAGGVSILRSLYIDNDTRNPKVKGVMEFVNNVVCKARRSAAATQIFTFTTRTTGMTATGTERSTVATFRLPLTARTIHKLRPILIQSRRVRLTHR